MRSVRWLGPKLLGVTVWVAAMIAGLAAPAHAQSPGLNLPTGAPESKTPEQKEAEAARDKAYKESLKKIPDAKAPADPWGGARSLDTPNTSASNTSASKTSAPVKPKTKAGSTAN
jgi:hypothetical protein